MIADGYRILYDTVDAMKIMYTYETSLPIAECRRRLSETTSYWRRGIDLGVQGLKLGNFFILWYLVTWGFLNVDSAGSIVCIGMLFHKHNGTHIQCYAGIHPLVILFLVCFFGASIWGIITCFASSLASGLLLLLIFWGPFLTFAIGLIIVSFVWSLEYKDDIMSYVERTFEVENK
jgi:hypothetical protein